MKILTLVELSALLQTSREALLCRRSRNPKSLPPTLKIPGDSRLLFDERVVKKWMRTQARSHSANRRRKKS